MMFGAVNKVVQWPMLDLFTIEEASQHPITEIPATNPKL
jgi:hypothetical protein